MKIQVLGTGCSRCKTLAANVKAALDELNIDAEIEKVEDMKQIMTFGVMSLPAIVIDSKVKSAGKVLTVDELKELLK